MALALTSVSPELLDSQGGTIITVEGTFDTSVAHRVFLGPAGTVDDPPCYSGVIGMGLDVYSPDGLTIQFVSPPGEKGANFVTVDDSSTTETEPVTLVEQSWKSKVHIMRKNCPKWYETGARSLGLEKRL